MGLIYGVTWYAMSLAMPGIFSLNTILRDCLEPDERTAEGLRFWLKYWVVFAYYFILEFVLDCFISWVPFYSELKLLLLIMASPITPFVAVKAFMGLPLEELDVNRSPVETIFHAVTIFNKSSRDGAHSIGLNRDAFRDNIQFASQQATQGLRLAGAGFTYMMAMLQNMQNVQRLQLASSTNAPVVQAPVEPAPVSSGGGDSAHRTKSLPKIKLSKKPSKPVQVEFDDSFSSSEDSLLRMTSSSGAESPPRVKTPPRIKTRASVKRRNARRDT